MHEMVAQIRDRLGDLGAILLDLPTGVKKRHDSPPTFPRPETAMDRARAAIKAKREQAYDDKINEFVEKAKERGRALTPEQRAVMWIES